MRWRSSAGSICRPDEEAFAGDAAGHCAILKTGNSENDPQIEIRRVPVVFTEEKRKDRKTAQPGDIFFAGEGQGA
jgi:hypothetical protein